MRLNEPRSGCGEDDLGVRGTVMKAERVENLRDVACNRFLRSSAQRRGYDMTPLYQRPGIRELLGDGDDMMCCPNGDCFYTEFLADQELLDQDPAVNMLITHPSQCGVDSSRRLYLRHPCASLPGNGLNDAGQ